MDFVLGLPRSGKGHDVIWVVVDRLMKLAHFILIKKTFPMHRLAELYIGEIVRLPDLPICMLSDCDPRFTSRF